MSPRKKKAPAPDQQPGGSDQSAGSVSRVDAEPQNTRSTEADAQDVIRINTDVDPELNPNDPRFNIKKYREYLSKLDLTDIEARLNKAVKAVTDVSAAAAHELTEKGILHAALPDMMISNLQEILQISEWAKETAQAAQQILLPQLRTLFDKNTADKITDFLEGLQAVEARIAALEPFLEKELPAIHKAQGLEDFTLDDLKSYIGLDGEPITEEPDGQPIPAAIRAALERAVEAARRAELPAATIKRPDIVEYPLDKVNSNIWNLLQETTGKQLKLGLNMAAEGSKEKLNIYYSIDFSNLEKEGLKITRQLTPFDKRVYIAIAALYNAGNKVMTLTQIHFAMGNTGRPSNPQLEKINESITKMRGANVFIDTLEESQRYNYPRFKYEDYLLPVARATAIVNGKLADAAIQLEKEPPIITFAKGRKQITTVTVKVLQSPISKTNANLLIDDYLIERIAQAKSGRQPKKILYSKIYERAQIKTKMQRQRAPDKIQTYLEHYKACGLISAYKMKEDGITIEF